MTKYRQVWDPYTNQMKQVKILQKGDVRKKWLAKSKTWDYEIIGDENWKPKKVEFVTKKILEQKLSTKWIPELETFEETSKHKENYKNDFENYQEQNNIKKLISLKHYAYFVIVELSFFYFFKKYPLKEIYYYSGKLSDLFENNSTLDRLKYRKSIDLPESIKKVSNNEYGLITYWVFKDAIVFKN